MAWRGIGQISTNRERFLELGWKGATDALILEKVAELLIQGPIFYGVSDQDPFLRPSWESAPRSHPICSRRTPPEIAQEIFSDP
jgi:hypothetical protein